MYRFVGTHLSRPFWYLLLAEAAVLFVVFYAGIFARWGELQNIISIVPQNFWSALFFTAVVSLMMIAMGLYHGPCSRTLVSVAGRLAVALLLSLLVFSLYSYAFPAASLWRSPLAVSMALAFIMVLLSRFAYLRIVDPDIVKTKILVLGTGPKASQIHQMEMSGQAFGFSCTGFLEEEGQAPRVPSRQILRRDRTILEIVRDLQVDEIVMALRDRRGKLPLQDLINCKFSGVGFIDHGDFLERETGQVHLDGITPSWFLFSRGFASSPLQDGLKRAFDVVFAIICLVFFLPIAIITAIAIRVESAGPVFYRQTRVGQHGERFEIIKFRSMRLDAEQDGEPVWAAVNDPRITAVGALIRKIRIDELPQILNVLHGDMSFVGPRPERPSFVGMLEEEIPYYHERHRVKPGITGWAQLNYIYGDSIEGAYRKLQYDLYYIKHFNIILDLFIIVQTIRVLLWPEGAR